MVGKGARMKLTELEIEELEASIEEFGISNLPTRSMQLYNKNVLGKMTSQEINYIIDNLII